jgi:hypothetical protein
MERSMEPWLFQADSDVEKPCQAVLRLQEAVKERTDQHHRHDRHWKVLSITIVKDFSIHSLLGTNNQARLARRPQSLRLNLHRLSRTLSHLSELVKLSWKTKTKLFLDKISVSAPLITGHSK